MNSPIPKASAVSLRGGIGRVDPDLLARHVDPLESSRYFLCGPGDMTRDLVYYLENRQVPRDLIHTETFGKKPVKPVLI